MDEYERIREAEGRGSERGDFYLGLPYVDASGRDAGQWHVRARSHDYVLRHLLAGTGHRPGAMVLDLGAGNCRSEEHTSELQSLMRISYAVFCLKKKKN